MITKDQSNNTNAATKALWGKIMQRAKQAVGDSVTIRSIDDLFNHLETIVNYEKRYHPTDSIVMFLPADESIFEIDANTRKITVPPAFANGISVQGDEIAEILYFSIDRYFDAVDLYDKEIYIQWENREGKMKILQPAFQKSLGIIDGKIVFGWPISSEVTEIAGPVNFSVRFYEMSKDKNELIYSFSTLTSTVKVNPGLDFDIVNLNGVSIVDKNDLIYDRIPLSKDAPSMPIFIIPEADDNDTDTSKPLIAYAKFDSGDENIGEITYSWLFTPEGNRGSIYLSDIPKYELTKDISRDLTKVYYTQNAMSGVYELFSGDFVNGTNYYERQASYVFSDYKYIESTDTELDSSKTYYTVVEGEFVEYNKELGFTEGLWEKVLNTDDIIGTYQAIATNIFENKATQNSSHIFTVQPPTEPVIEMAEYLVLDDSVQLSATVTSNGSESYQWLKAELNENVFTPIDNANSKILTNEELKKSKEGIYKLQVINSKNRRTKEIVSEPGCLVTYPASDFTIKIYANGEELAKNEAPVGTVLTAECVFEMDSPYSDAIEYEWYDEDNGTLESSSNSYTLQNAGADYYVKVLNKYYNSEKENRSNTITAKRPIAE